MGGILPVANGGTGSSSQNFVDISNAQSIGGVKDFTTGMRVSGATNPSSGAGLELLYVANTGIVQAYDRSGAAWKPMAISGSEVAIGISGSSNVIDVTAANGTGIKFSYYGAGAATFSASGVISSVSDERQKDFYSYRSSPSVIQRLDAATIRYSWKPETGIDTGANIGHQYIGFSAQKVQEALPDAVMQGPDGYLALQDRPILAALVNAVAELQRQIDALKSKE